METTQRQTYLDCLRILSILGVLIFHTGMPYVANDFWHIKNQETSYLIFESNFFLHLFRMPLLFFISGTVSYYMMQRRSSLSFIGIRFRRLFIPLLAGVFIIVPPQIYMERLTNGYHGNFWSFYPSVFQFVPYPHGSLSWHHLWFIAYLFVYDLLMAPLFAWLVSFRSKVFVEKLKALATGKWVYLLAIPGVIWYALSCRQLPETDDLIHDGYFFYWFFFLVAGFICILQPELMASLERNRRVSLTVGFFGLVLLDYLRWNKFEPGHEQWHLQGKIFIYAFDALTPIAAWGWVLALIGYGKCYLNRKFRGLNYLNQAVYPFYILHQTVIVILAFYIVRTPNESILSKYMYTFAMTFFITILSYHLLIRPFAFMRFLFGMKPKEKPRQVIPLNIDTDKGMPAITPAENELITG